MSRTSGFVTAAWYNAWRPITKLTPYIVGLFPLKWVVSDAAPLEHCWLLQVFIVSLQKTYLMVLACILLLSLVEVVINLYMARTFHRRVSKWHQVQCEHPHHPDQHRHHKCLSPQGVHELEPPTDCDPGSKIYGISSVTNWDLDGPHVSPGPHHNPGLATWADWSSAVAASFASIPKPSSLRWSTSVLPIQSQISEHFAAQGKAKRILFTRTYRDLCTNFAVWFYVFLDLIGNFFQHNLFRLWYEGFQSLCSQFQMNGKSTYYLCEHPQKKKWQNATRNIPLYFLVRLICLRCSLPCMCFQKFVDRITSNTSKEKIYIATSTPQYEKLGQYPENIHTEQANFNGKNWVNSLDENWALIPRDRSVRIIVVNVLKL